MRTLRDIPRLANIPVLVRGSLNVPLENGRVTSDYRLRSILPTLTYLTERKARVILIGHIGDLGTETLAPVASALEKLLPHVHFCTELRGPAVRARVRDLLPGHVLVLENLRKDAGEKKNDPTFARELALLADLFVQDSFDACHRAHASIVSIPAFLPSYAGLTLEREIAELTAALTPEPPSLAIIGGAKFATKKAVLDKLLASYDQVFVGGALANDFFQARGLEVGKSLVSGAPPDSMRPLLEHPRLLLPVDVVAVAGKEARVARADAVDPRESILDVGPKTVEMLAERARGARTVLWNGPLGNYENGYAGGTEALARALATSRACTTVGGGDTVAAIEKLDSMDRFSFVSTGGGAMLDFLAYGTLPGIKALG